MNYGAHLHVAHEVSPKLIRPEQMHIFGLGTMLLDFIHMSGSRMRPDATQGKQTAFSRGVKFHKRTDDIFHGLDGFQTAVDRLRSDLVPLADNPHEARAWAHAGIELVIDGGLFNQADFRTTYRQALATLEYDESIRILSKFAVSGAEFGDWLRSYTERPLPSYDDPRQIVDALRRRLAHRSKTAKTRASFDEEAVGPITEVLGAHIDGIREVGVVLIAQTVEKLKTPEVKVTVEPSVDPDEVRSRQSPGHLIFSKKPKGYMKGQKPRRRL